MSDSPDNDEVKITVRLPYWLHAIYEKRAGQLRRSLNSEFVMALDRYKEAKEVSLLAGQILEAPGHTGIAADLDMSPEELAARIAQGRTPANFPLPPTKVVRKKKDTNEKTG